MSSKKKTLESSKPTILAAAAKLAVDRGLLQFSRAQVAKAASVGESTVSYHFGKMIDLQTAVVAHAVKHRLISVLADARAARESFSSVPMSEELRERVAAYMTR